MEWGDSNYWFFCIQSMLEKPLCSNWTINSCCWDSLRSESKSIVVASLFLRADIDRKGFSEVFVLSWQSPGYTVFIKGIQTLHITFCWIFRSWAIIICIWSSSMLLIVRYFWSSFKWCLWDLTNEYWSLSDFTFTLNNTTHQSSKLRPLCNILSIT